MDRELADSIVIGIKKLDGDAEVRPWKGTYAVMTGHLLNVTEALINFPELFIDIKRDGIIEL